MIPAAIMKFRAHRDVVAACTRQAEGHARSNGGLPRFRIARRHQQIALETVCAIAAIVIDRFAALTVRGRIKPLAGHSKTLLVGHTATPEGSAAVRAGVFVKERVASRAGRGCAKSCV